MIKSIVIIAFILIIISLGSALFHLVRHNDQDQSRSTAKALTFRIGLSILLFIFVFIAIATGLYKPSGIGAHMQMKKPVKQAISNNSN
jgi:uncharacterized protein YacL